MIKQNGEHRSLAACRRAVCATGPKKALPPQKAPRPPGRMLLLRKSGALCLLLFLKPRHGDSGAHGSVTEHTGLAESRPAGGPVVAAIESAHVVGAFEAGGAVVHVAEGRAVGVGLHIHHRKAGGDGLLAVVLSAWRMLSVMRLPNSVSPTVPSPLASRRPMRSPKKVPGLPS